MRRALRQLGGRRARAHAEAGRLLPLAGELPLGGASRGYAAAALWQGDARESSRTRTFSPLHGGARGCGILHPVHAALRHARWDSTRAAPMLAASVPPPDALHAAAHAAGAPGSADAAAAASEVASIAAESNAGVAALQQMVEWIHVTYDLPWWLAIVASTVALRTAIAPLTVLQMKNTAKLTLARPEMERLQARMKTQMTDPDAVKTYQREVAAVWQKYDANPFKSFLPILAQGPLFVCFFLAIKRMSALPSFHEGGAYWFMDLSVADPLYIMPLLSGATFLATVELGAADGMQGNPAANNVKWAMRALAVVLVPLTASFPQGVFVYWITSNVFSFFQALVFKWQALRAALGIPDTRHLASPSGLKPQVVPPSALLNNKPAPKHR